MGLGAEPGRYPPEVMRTYRRALDDPASVEAMCEDYRAGASIDIAHDDTDREASHRIACPVLVLWAGRGGLPGFYPDVVEVWSAWASDVRGEALDAKHFLAEDRPEETAHRLLSFLADADEPARTPTDQEP